MAEISEESYLKLKKILEKQNHTIYTMEEIKEIGNGLLDFYELLAELDSESKSDDNQPSMINPVTQ